MFFFHQVRTLRPTLEALKMCVLCAISLGADLLRPGKAPSAHESPRGECARPLLRALLPVHDFTAQMILSLAGVQLPDWAGSIADRPSALPYPRSSCGSAGWLYLKNPPSRGAGLWGRQADRHGGSFLGVRGALVTLVLGSFVGSVIGFGYIKLTGKDPATFELPFGSFLGGAALTGGRLQQAARDVGQTGQTIVSRGLVGMGVRPRNLMKNGGAGAFACQLLIRARAFGRWKRLPPPTAPGTVCETGFFRLCHALLQFGRGPNR